MSDITYEEEFQDLRTPLLKIFVLILYILPIPVLIFVVFDLFRLLRPGLNEDSMWIIIRAVIASLIAIFSWISSNGLYNLKSWAPKFTIAGFIISLIGLVYFLVRGPQIYTMIEITNGFLIGNILVLLLGIIVIIKNKEKFTQ